MSGSKAEEVPAFAAVKLKKRETVKQEREEQKMEVVELKSHEFETMPENEYPEEQAGVVHVTAEIEDLQEIQEKKRAVLKKKKVMVAKRPKATEIGSLDQGPQQRSLSFFLLSYTLSLQGTNR